MNTSRFIASVAIALTTGTLCAQGALAAEDPQPKTRAQVYAELEQARADGSFYSLGESTPRRQTRARLAEHEARAKRARAEAQQTPVADRPAGAAQRAGS